MARSDKEAKDQWCAYIKAGLARKGWDAMAMVRASEAAAQADGGGPFVYKTVNNWENARAIPDADVVARVAQLFGDPYAAAMEAASKPVLAGVFRAEKRTPAPGPAEGLTEFAKGIRSIKARGLPPEREQRAIEDFTNRANKVVGLVDEVFRNEVPETRTAAARSA